MFWWVADWSEYFVPQGRLIAAIRLQKPASARSRRRIQNAHDQTTENSRWGVTDLSTQKGPLSPLRAQVSTAYRPFTFPTKGRRAMVRRVQPPGFTPADEAAA